MADAHDVQDLTRAEVGAADLERALRAMPVVAAVGGRLAEERALEGTRIGACLPLTPETGALFATLARAGAEIVACGADPTMTDDDIAAALVERHGVAVHARSDADAAAFYRHLDAVADHRPQIVLDAGADLLGLIHAARREVLDGVIAGIEETAIGVGRLRELEDDGVLAVPVIAVDEARAGRLFDARFGTGRAALDAVTRLADLRLAQRVVVVAGYGWTGQGIAVRAREAGAEVVVTEIDSLRALQAVADGFRVVPLGDALGEADLVITATGAPRVLDGRHIDGLRDGTVLCNAGHAAIEIDVAALRDRAATVARPRPGVEEIVLPDGRRVVLLADGQVVDRALGEEPAPAILDVRAALQALAAVYAVRQAETLESRVYVVPHDIDEEVARLGLAAMHVEFDDAQ